MTHQTPFYNRKLYHYELPEHLIAQSALRQRDHSKLLVRQLNGETSHHMFRDLAALIPADSLLVVNESKVIPARLYGSKGSGASIEVFLLEENPNHSLAKVRWSCLARPMKKLKVGDTIFFENNLTAVVVEKPAAEADQLAPIEIEFNLGCDSFAGWLRENAKMPLPPYINRAKKNDVNDASDLERYQTVYSTQLGSVAAPTAGLHFTDEVLQQLFARGVEVAKLCLHVGAGTFLPVKSDDIRNHKMHEERFSVSKQTTALLHDAALTGRPIIAVGTTSFRTLESLRHATQGHTADLDLFADRELRTSIFIHPNENDTVYKPWLCKGLITNFHQPESTLFMLICALLGTEKAKAMYDEAIEKQYRFLSYGDSSLLWL